VCPYFPLLSPLISILIYFSSRIPSLLFSSHSLISYLSIFSLLSHSFHYSYLAIFLLFFHYSPLSLNLLSILNHFSLFHSTSRTPYSTLNHFSLFSLLTLSYLTISMLIFSFFYVFPLLLFFSHFLFHYSISIFLSFPFAIFYGFSHVNLSNELR